jgi:hypothetical protein
MPEGGSAKARGEFFVVDAVTFAKACDLGADAAAAYLVMACGTGRDSRTSTWSRDAISRHLGLTWRKARQKVDDLKTAGLVVELTPAKARRPKFDLPPLERAPMPAAVARLAERIRSGLQPTGKMDLHTVRQGQDLGWFAREEQGLWRFLEKPEGRAAFIPKSMIIRDDGQPSIVERLRQARDPKTLQLLVDLYALQDLAERDGLAFRKTFTRESVQATSLHQLWRFKDEGRAQGEAGLAHHYEGNGGPAFWRRITLLEDVGAIEWAYYLAEDGQPDAGLVYPVALVRSGRVIEGALESVAGAWATLAAAVLHKGDDTEKFDDFADQAPFAFTLPVPRHMREAALVGVLRMRNRAWTTNTSRWRQTAEQRAQEAVEGFRRIVEAESPDTIRRLLAREPKRFTFSRPAEDPPIDWEERRRRLDAEIAEREALAASNPPVKPAANLESVFPGIADFNVSSTLVQRDINSPSDQVSHGAQRDLPVVEKPSASDFAELVADMRRGQKPPSRRAQG